MKENLFDIKDKVVVMTGACGVLGGTIVKYFASQGAKVVLLDLERASSIGEALVKEIAAEGGEAMFLATNVLDKQVLEKLEQFAAETGTKVFNSKIRECVKVKEAQENNKLLIDYAPKCTTMEDYNSFTEELLGNK